MFKVDDKVYVRDGRFSGLRGVIINEEDPCLVQIEHNAEMDYVEVGIPSEYLIPTNDSFKIVNRFYDDEEVVTI